jgi:hypothetical protein
MFDLHKHHRRSIRLKYWDYTSPGLYAVTICINHHLPLLGEITNATMHLNPAGRTVGHCWHELPSIFPNVTLD